MQKQSPTLWPTATLSYVRSSQSAVGQVQAQVLQSASNAAGPSPIARMIIFAVLGGLAGALIGVIVALAIGRNDRRLRERDEIANSIGIPVIASVPVAHPSNAAGWTKLLEGYKPTAVHSWQLRTALQQLGMPVAGFGSPAHNGNGSSSYYDDRVAMYDSDGGCFSLLVLSLSSDSGALALGPQLAVFAASQNIPTSLVIGPQQDAAATATLRTACAAPLSEASLRHGLLRVTAYDEGGGVDLQPDTALAIVVGVVDGRAPRMPDTMRTSATAIGVSAGAATAEQLARAAVVAVADGREVTGILVADPDPDDQTTGRIPHLARSARTQAAQPPARHSNGDQTVNDPDRTITWSRGDELLGRLWADDTTEDEERSAAELSAGGRLVTLGFLTAALRRKAWVWCLTAVAGLAIGTGLYVKFPPAYHATATVLLVYSNPDGNPEAEVPSEQSVAESRISSSTCRAATEAAAVCGQLPGRLLGHGRY